MRDFVANFIIDHSFDILDPVCYAARAVCRG